MNRIKKGTVYTCFTLSYGVFFSLGLTCLLNLLGIAFAIGLDGHSVAEQYPRYIPFCLIMGLLCLAILITEFVINMKYFEKLGYSKPLMAIQLFVSFLISLPMLNLWSELFVYMQRIF